MRILVRTTPNAKENKVTEDNINMFGERTLKLKVNQPPEDGKANKAVLELLSEYFNVKKKKITIISGEKSRNKVVEIG